MRKDLKLNFEQIEALCDLRLALEARNDQSIQNADARDSLAAGYAWEAIDALCKAFEIEPRSREATPVGQ